MAIIGRKGKTSTAAFVVVMAVLTMLYVTDIEPVSLIAVIAGCVTIAYVAAMMILGRNQ